MFFKVEKGILDFGRMAREMGSICSFTVMKVNLPDLRVHLRMTYLQDLESYSGKIRNKYEGYFKNGEGHGNE